MSSTKLLFLQSLILPTFFFRFRGPPPMSHSRHGQDNDDGQKRPSIVSDKKLKDFEEILKTDNETGWAGPQGEIDYRYYNILNCYF